LLGGGPDKNGELKIKDHKKCLSDLSKTDKDGRNALLVHLQSMPFGQAFNESLISDLLSLKIKGDLPDKSGRNAMDYAISNKNSALIELLASHGLKPKKEKMIALEKGAGKPCLKFEEVRQERQKYEDDAEKFIHMKMKEQEAEKMKVDEPLVKPDSVDEFKSGEVAQGEHNYLDVLLTKVDVKGFFGVANFYVIQVIYDKVKNFYILWTRWGRIGDRGQF